MLYTLMNDNDIISILSIKNSATCSGIVRRNNCSCDFACKIYADNVLLYILEAYLYFFCNTMGFYSLP